MVNAFPRVNSESATRFAAETTDSDCSIPDQLSGIFYLDVSLYFWKLIFVLFCNFHFIHLQRVSSRNADRGNILGVQVNLLLLFSNINYFMDASSFVSRSLNGLMSSRMMD